MKEKTEAKNALHDAAHAAHQHVNVAASKMGGAHQKGSQNLYANKDVISQLGESGTNKRSEGKSQPSKAGEGLQNGQSVFSGARKVNPKMHPDHVAAIARQVALENGSADTSKGRNK